MELIDYIIFHLGKSLVFGDSCKIYTVPSSSTSVMLTGWVIHHIPICGTKLLRGSVAPWVDTTGWFPSSSESVSSSVKEGWLHTPWGHCELRLWATRVWCEGHASHCVFLAWLPWENHTRSCEMPNYIQADQAFHPLRTHHQSVSSVKTWTSFLKADCTPSPRRLD